MQIKATVSALALLSLAACSGSEETVYTGPDGEEVTVQREGDGTTTYRSEDGETTISTGTLDTTAVGDVPMYPGATSREGLNLNTTARDGGRGQISSFQTNDSPSDVIGFYRNALQSRGYSIAATMDMGQSQMLVAERNDGNGGVQITATDIEGRGTNVTVIAGSEG